MAKWVREKFILPPNLTAREREAVEGEILRFLRERTDKGQGKGGKAFPQYSKDYIKTLDFSNAGKRASKVNLKLSGDMIAAMDILSSNKKRIFYGYEKGTPENDRAEGNILGSYGGAPDARKARDFLGLTQKEIQIILKRAGLGG